MARKNALGKGLNALLSPLPQTDTASEVGGLEVREIAIDRIHRSTVQPRNVFSEASINHLADSIREAGVMQPIVVRPRGEDGYELVAGERRWRAAAKAGQESLPAIVREVDDSKALLLALVENLQREDLNPMDEAEALGQLCGEYGLTHEQAAHAIGKSRTTVTNQIRLLNLHKSVANLLREGKLEIGHARALLTLDKSTQAKTGREIVRSGLSVRQTEALVRRIQQNAQRPESRKQSSKSPDILRLETELSDSLGASVSIQFGKSGANRGKGRLVISYNSLDELDGIIDQLKQS